MLARAPRNVTMGHVDNGLVLGRLKELGNSRSVTIRWTMEYWCWSSVLQDT